MLSLVPLELGVGHLFCHTDLTGYFYHLATAGPLDELLRILAAAARFPSMVAAKPWAQLIFLLAFVGIILARGCC